MLRCPDCERLLVVADKNEEMYFCKSCQEYFSLSDVEDAEEYRYQAKTGRCYYCGRPLLECECEIDFLDWRD